MILKSKKNIALLSLIAGSFITTNSFAAGFAIKEQSTRWLGTAFAGAASAAQDSSTGFYNSAGLTELNDTEFQAALMLTKGHFKLTPYTATYNRSGGSLAKIASTKPRSGAQPIPAIHMAKRLDNKWVLGFNIVSPFGLGVEYGTGSTARYMATKSKLLTVNMGPSLGYKVDNNLSVGFGIDAMYTKVWYDAALNAAAGTPPGAGDGYSRNKGDSWSFSFHTGLLYKLSDSTKMGLHYRHKHMVRASGRKHTRTTAVSAQTISNIKANVDLPESLVYSVYHKFNNSWDVMADVEWMRWSRFERLTIIDTTNSTYLNSPQNFKNAWRISLGTVYNYNDDWKFRAGAAFDQSPVKHAHRTVRIPDSNRVWLALGAQYNVNRDIKLDFGYTHIFFSKAPISDSAPEGATALIANNTISGQYKSHGDVVGIQLTWNFM